MSLYHVYSLPRELLETLTPRNLVNQTPARSPTPEVAPPASTGPRACNVCLGITFLDVNDQRAHFRSDWHRYNVKARLGGGNTVTEAQFTQLVDELDESISGSASSDDDDASNDSDAVNALVNKAKRRNRSPSPDSTGPSAPQTALTWFHSPPSTQIGVYKALFPRQVEASSHLSALKEMQDGVNEGRSWAMFMVAGGHFAGAIVRVSPTIEEEPEPDHKGKRQKLKKPKPDTEVLKHKTFHRYTTRRKQGGSQSVNDNAKGNAKSAGAQLRRYGEQALRDDIRNLLQEWQEEIDMCERIWIRASTSNRRIFLDYEEAVIAKGDERLRTFPFPTRRPTQSELSRCLLELTRVKVSHLTEDALRAQDEAFLASLPKPKPKPAVVVPPEREKPKVPKLSKEEETLRDKWSRCLEMVAKGRLEPLKAFWEREGSSIGNVDTPIPDWAGERRATFLQVAAEAGSEDVVRWLLEELDADPTIPVPTSKGGEVDEPQGHESDASESRRELPKGTHRTAYDLARTRGVRDVFRRCAGAYPDQWDWLGAGRVPSTLNKEMEDEREEKKKIRRKGLKDKVKERQAKLKEKEPEPEPISPPQPVQKVAAVARGAAAQRLGGGSGATDGVTGLTPEMRAKVERERRARAAEARLKALEGK